MPDAMAAARDFIDRLAGIYGDDLVAGLLYGSAARGDFREGRSDLNLLVILRSLDFRALRRAIPVVSDWVATGNPPPMMLSADEWQNSVDVFPAEFSDIRDAHVLLAGRDPFEHLEYDRTHLRHQLEHELRSRKIQLREAYLAYGDSPPDLGGVLLSSISTFLALFRGIQRLAEADVPADPSELARAVAVTVGFDPASILKLIEVRDRSDEFRTDLNEPLAGGLLEAVERTARWLDRFRVGGPEPEAS